MLRRGFMEQGELMPKVTVFSFLLILFSTNGWAGVSVTHCRSSTGQHFCHTDKDLVIVWAQGNDSISIVAQNAYGCEIPYEKSVVLEKLGDGWRSRDGRVSMTITDHLIKYDDLDRSLDEWNTPFHFSRSSCTNE